MKKHHRLVSLASALLLALAALPCTAMAAEAGDTEPAQGAPPPAALYPAEVRTSEENGMIRLEKVYYLSTRDDPAAIPTGDFDREGRHYTLLDVLKNDLSETDSKDYIEVVTLDSSTKDMAEIIKMLEPEREIATEDGYTGILNPVHRLECQHLSGHGQRRFEKGGGPFHQHQHLGRQCGPGWAQPGCK